MKKLLAPTFMILIATLFIAVMPTEAEGAIYDDTVRLHILANSDSNEDQELKLKLRDAILKEYASELSVFESVEDAKTSINEKLSEIQNFASQKIKDFGYDYPVTVTLTEEWYDTRVYEGFSLPKGYYTSLRVMIGEAEGKNWWCVMFPPLCLDASLGKGGYSKEEECLVTKKYVVKFKILELISELGR